MEFYQLRTFVIVAEEQSITKAAKRLYTTPPSVSAHIKALEVELKVQLFERSATGMQITEKGRILREKAEKTLLAAQDFVNHASMMQDQLLGNVRFGINATSDYLRVPQIAKKLNDVAPGIELQIISSDTGQILESLQNSTMDIAYVFGQEVPDSLARHKLTETELVVAAPAAWRSQIETANWQAVSALPWIYSNHYCPFEELAVDLFAQHNLEFNRALCSNNETTKCELIASGVGISLLERGEAEKAVAQGKVCIWKTEPITCELAIAYVAQRDEDPLLSAVRATVLKVWQVSP